MDWREVVFRSPLDKAQSHLTLFPVRFRVYKSALSSMKTGNVQGISPYHPGLLTVRLRVETKTLL